MDRVLQFWEMAEKEKDGNFSKRRRITGSSKWTLDKISRQITESQATLDVDKMIMMQGLDSGGYAPTSTYHSNEASSIFLVSLV